MPGKSPCGSGLCGRLRAGYSYALGPPPVTKGHDGGTLHARLRTDGGNCKRFAEPRADFGVRSPWQLGRRERWGPQWPYDGRPGRRWPGPQFGEAAVCAGRPGRVGIARTCLGRTFKRPEKGWRVARNTANPGWSGEFLREAIQRPEDRLRQVLSTREALGGE